MSDRPQEQGSKTISIVEAEAVVRGLAEEGVPYVVIGSYCVALLAPGLLNRAPRDLDLLIPADRRALEAFVRSLGARGYVISSWQEALSLPLDMAKLRGRYYLRATRGGRIVDATYESPWLPFPETYARAQRVGPFVVACLDDQKKLYRARNSEADRQVLRKLAQDETTRPDDQGEERS